MNFLANSLDTFRRFPYSPNVAIRKPFDVLQTLVTSPRSSLFRLLLALAVCAAAGCRSLSRSRDNPDLDASRRLASQGVDAIQHNRWDEGEAFLRQSLELHPHDDRTHRQYAETLWRRGDTNRALSHMEKALRLSGGDPTLRAQLGERYLSLNNLAAAELQARQSLQDNPRLAEGWALLGDVQKQRGQWADALASYHQATHHRGRYPKVQLAIAEIHQLQGRHQRSLATLRALAEGYPPHQTPPHVNYLQGLALKEMGRYESATEQLLLARNRGPAHSDLLFHLADAQWRGGDSQEAHRNLAAALAMDPQHVASRRLQTQIGQPRRFAARP